MAPAERRDDIDLTDLELQVTTEDTERKARQDQADETFNDQDFLDFIALIPGHEDMDMEDHDKILAIHETYTKTKTLTEEVVGLLREKVAEDTGVEFGDQEIGCVREHLKNIAVSNPEHGLDEINTAVVRYKASISRVERAVADFQTASEHLHVAQAEQMHRDDERAQVRANLRKFSKGARIFSNITYRGKAKEAVGKAYELDVDYLRITDDPDVKSDEQSDIDAKSGLLSVASDRLEVLRIKSHRACEATKLELLTIFKEDTNLANLISERILSRVMQETTSAVRSENIEDVQKYLEDIDVFDYFDGEEQFQSRQEAISKTNTRIEELISAEIQEAVNTVPLNNRPLEQLSGSIKKYLQKERIGSHRGEAQAKEFLSGILSEAYQKTDDKAKRVLISRICATNGVPLHKEPIIEEGAEDLSTEDSDEMTLARGRKMRELYPDAQQYGQLSPEEQAAINESITEEDIDSIRTERSNIERVNTALGEQRRAIQEGTSGSPTDSPADQTTTEKPVATTEPISTEREWMVEGSMELALARGRKKDELFPDDITTQYSKLTDEQRKQIDSSISEADIKQIQEERRNKQRVVEAIREQKTVADQPEVTPEPIATTSNPDSGLAEEVNDTPPPTE